MGRWRAPIEDVSTSRLAAAAPGHHEGVDTDSVFAFRVDMTRIFLVCDFG